MSIRQAAETSVKYTDFLAELTTTHYEDVRWGPAYAGGTRVLARVGRVWKAFLISDLTAPAKASATHRHQPNLVNTSAALTTDPFTTTSTIPVIVGGAALTFQAAQASGTSILLILTVPSKVTAGTAWLDFNVDGVDSALAFPISHTAFDTTTVFITATFADNLSHTIQLTAYVDNAAHTLTLANLQDGAGSFAFQMGLIDLGTTPPQ